VHEQYIVLRDSFVQMSQCLFKLSKGVDNIVLCRTVDCELDSILPVNSVLT